LDYLVRLKNIILLLLLTATALIGVIAQNQSNSPVYKNYKNPSPSEQLKRSDIDYNLMHIFVLERKAYAGDVAAQQELGLRYLLGEGVEADTLKGAFWIKRAAEQNSADAAYNLGILEFNGMGIPWNPFHSYKLFKSAAEQGMPEAEYIFSMFLTENLVVPRNWRKLTGGSRSRPMRGTLRPKRRLPISRPGALAPGHRVKLPRQILLLPRRRRR
jgi:TPR repeat protein